jgi:PHS family inorganic phosphate transporter-like MFS transporter
VGNLIIVLAGAVPGYWFTVATVDTIGRKPLQLAGFAILTILFIVMGFAYHKLSANGLLAIYVLAQFFFNFGPNSTTFIVPGECFPTRYRSTSHGISAAAGKVSSLSTNPPSSSQSKANQVSSSQIGSIIGQGAIAPLRYHGATQKNPSPWLDHVLEIYALFMLLGCFSTLLIKETKRKTLEELAGEDEYDTDATIHPSPTIHPSSASVEGGVIGKKGPDSV